MTLLSLYLEFFKTGLFAVGGGMATIPFLMEIADRTGWFTIHQLTDMIAVSESTPGPIGINTATFAGFTTAGIPGAILATLGLVTPSIIVILIIAGILEKFRDNRYVDAAFHGLRASSTALIASAGITLAGLTFIGDGSISWASVILALVIFYFSKLCKKTRKLHPIVFIAAAAVAGIVLGL